MARCGDDLPVLRKDFMYDPYQVTEARAWGADCILVIMAAIEDVVARELEDAAMDLAWTCCSRCIDQRELERALACRSRLIGINNRDLKTFETTLATGLRLAPLIPRDRVAVGESGIFTPADLDLLASSGMSTFLVGESLMRQATSKPRPRAAPAASP